MVIAIIIKKPEDKNISVLKKIVEDKDLYHDEIIGNFNNDIVSFSISGNPIDRKTYKQELERARLEIENGDVISQEDLEIQSETW